MLKEIHRTLKNGGHLIVTEELYATKEDLRMRNDIDRSVNDVLHPGSSLEHIDDHHGFYLKEDIEKIFMDSGFEIVDNIDN